MAITPLPDVPSRQDPSTFSAKTDAFLSALPTFVTEANALQTDVNSKQSTATTAANTATTKASEALASANTATTKASEALASANEAYLSTLLYLGGQVSDPATGKLGAPLVVGNWYTQTAGTIRAYNGASWVQGVSSVAGVSSVNGLSGAVTINLSGQNLSLFNSGII